MCYNLANEMGDFMNFLKSFVAGLFTLIFGVLVVVTICVFNVSGFASKENIVNQMENTDILTEVKKIRNSGSGEGGNGLSQVIDEMYSLASQFSVSEEVVDSIIDSKITKEIIGDAVGNLTDYVVNGKETKALTADDAYNLINENLDDILKESNISLDDGQKEKFLREIKKQLPDMVEAIPTTESLANSSYINQINLLQEVFGTRVKVILCIGIAISGLIVIVLKRKEFEWCANMGVALLLAGLVTLGLSLVIPSFVVDMIGTTDMSLLASSISDSLAKPILYSGIGTLVLALLLFIFYKVMERKADTKIKS